jgi:uncharacterized membrane protein YjfL (UPF0719 family)
VDTNTLLWQDARALSAALAAIATALMLVTLAKYAFGRLVLSGCKLDDELFIRDNPAAAILVLGYGGALLTIAMGVVRAEAHQKILHELAVIVCAVSAGALLVLIGAGPLLALLGVPLKKSVIEDRNVGVALAAAGAYIAEGFLVHGVVATTPADLPPGSPGLWDETTILTALGFFVVAQVPLIVSVLLYRKLCGFDVKAELARGNVAAGLSYGSCIAAMGLVIGHAARGEFRGWTVALIEFAIYAVFGLVLLPSLRFAVSAVLVPNSSLTHEVGRQDVPNWGAALLEAFAYLGAAGLVVASS